MAIIILASVGTGSTNGNTITTTPVMDTTGADLCVIGVADYNNVTIGTLTSSKAGTVTPLTTYATGTGPRVKLYYIAGGTVGASHTFTYTITGGVPTVCAMALSGMHASPFDQESGNAVLAGGTTIQPGAITPSQNSNILITMYMANNTVSATIDSGFTIRDQVVRVAGQHFEGAMAYEIQTTATLRNPTWTEFGGNYRAVAMASFKAAAAGGSPSRRSLTMLGIG